VSDPLNPTITYEQAVDAHRRYMNMQFKKGGEQPVAHIPAQPDSDTDLVLGGYLRQSREQIGQLTRDLAAARKQLAAANATVEKCKQVAESAIEREKEKDTHGDAFEVCHLALTEIVTAAEAAREGKGGA
jgi:hypothetical protein